jgi:hypothetical protein
MLSDWMNLNFQTISRKNYLADFFIDICTCEANFGFLNLKFKVSKLNLMKDELTKPNKEQTNGPRRAQQQNRDGKL